MRSLFLEGDRSLHQREVWPQTPADGLWNSAVPRGSPPETPRLLHPGARLRGRGAVRPEGC